MDRATKCHSRLFPLGPKCAGVGRYLAVYALVCLVLSTDASPAQPCDKSCLSGTCINGTCVCDRGWVGDQCQHCQGRFK